MKAAKEQKEQRDKAEREAGRKPGGKGLHGHRDPEFMARAGG